jgi:hypothetical protein
LRPLVKIQKNKFLKQCDNNIKVGDRIEFYLYYENGQRVQTNGNMDLIEGVVIDINNSEDMAKL